MAALRFSKPEVVYLNRRLRYYIEIQCSLSHAKN